MDNKNEDKDSSVEAWKYYKKIYTENHWPLITKFDLENVCTYEYREGKPPKKIKRYLAYIKKECASEFGPKFSLGGECDFNFNSKKEKQFEKMIEKDGNHKELKEQLAQCCSMHYNNMNFSIMATTGGMNNFKGRVYFDGNNIKDKKGKWHKSAFDRLDTFVYCLNTFYKAHAPEDTLILRGSTFTNRPYLKKYLGTFQDIYDYCKKIYFIDEKEFVDELINNGCKPIENAYDLKQYMNLATKYWEIKKWNIKVVGL